MTIPIEQDEDLEVIKSEESDTAESPAVYEIVTYPADYTLEGLVSKLDSKQLTIPGFQRKYVWTQTQASKLIESFLLGLPVPTIFLYIDPETNTLEVIDGQQRLLSIAQYFDGYFGEESVSHKQTVFALTGLSEKSPFHGKTYKQLEAENPSAFTNLNNSVLRAFIIRQLNPKDKTSIYHIFERLNTGGTQLAGQEIRNCIYQGSFNDMLHELNMNSDWRAIFGNSKENKRQRDIELILRFFALHANISKYKRPMVDFLSEFMRDNRNPSPPELKRFKETFELTVNLTKTHLPPRPFHIRKGLNAAAFDAVFPAIAEKSDQIPADLQDRFSTLLKSEKFKASITSGTTTPEAVSTRRKEANQILFG